MLKLNSDIPSRKLAFYQLMMLDKGTVGGSVMQMVGRIVLVHDSTQPQPGCNLQKRTALTKHQTPGPTTATEREFTRLVARG